MASRKEYELLLRLEAETNGTFSKTFSKAQQQILSLQKDIQSLNKVQGDISAYNKQQAAVEATNKKLEVLRQQYDNIQKEIDETGQYSSDLQNKLLAKQQQIEKTTAALDQQTQKLNQMDDALKSAGVDTSNLEKESQRLEAELGDLKQKQEDVAEGAQSFGNQSVQAFNAVSEAIAAAGIATALHAIYEGYAQCVGVAADFEESMSNVKALSQASEEEMDMLEAMAKELGATTKFTAKESADAMGYMAMAGWDTQQMLAGMPSVLQLAAASGEDLASVSDIVTDSLTAFGLTAADTGRYVDVLAATATNANTNVGIMGETFKYAAPVAGALGYSIEDVSTAIGLMANAGVKGSNAGTALRNVFNGLLGGVTLTSAAFGECEISAVKTDGTMKDFGETIDELRGYFDQMTEAERVNNASAIAGQRGYAGLLSILNATEADYAKLTGSINNCSGAAQRMADIKLDNMNGQLTLMNSAWEAVQTTIGEQLTPDLQKLYGVGADVLGGVNKFLQEHPELIKAATAFVGVIGAATAGIVAYSAATKVAIPLMKLFAASIPGVNVIAGVTLGVAALTAAVVALSDAEESGEAQARKLTESSRQEYERLQELQAEYEEVVSVYGETSDQALYLAWRIDDLSDSFEANKKSLKDYIDECDQLNDSLNDTLDSNKSAYTEMRRDSDTSLSLVHRLQELAAQTDKTTETQEEMRVIIAALNKEVPGLSLSYEDVANGVSDYGAAIEKTVKAQAMMQKYEDAHQKAADAQIAAEKAKAKYDEIAIERAAAQERVNAAQAAYNELMANTPMDSFGGAEALSWSSQQYKELEAARNALAEYDAALTETGETLQKANDDYTFYIAECTGYAEQTYANADATAMLESRIEDTVADVQSLVQAYSEAYESAYSSVHGQYALWDEAEQVVAVSAGTINSALESQAKYWEDYNSNLQALSQRTGEIAGLSDVIASFADGSKESVNAIAGMATASDDDLKKMVANWQKVQEEQEAASGSIADLKTDFTNTMDELQQALAEDIEAMDLSDEAAEAGRATIQAFIDSAASMESQVQAAYDRLGLAAANGLAKASGYHVNVSTNTSGNHTLTGYASGTENATQGAHLVGEYGPELVLFGGGEQVLDAERTERLFAEPRTPVAALPGFSFADGGGDVVTVSFAPVYHIEGNAQPEEIEAILREHDADLREQIEDVMESIAADKARCAFR